jgi:hypothetical protein
MNTSIFKDKGSIRVVKRTRQSWIELAAIFLALIATAWFVGWSPYVEPHWISRYFAAFFIALAVWMLVFAAIQKNFCVINTRKKVIFSTQTAVSFRQTMTQYSWDDFCIVRSVLMYSGDTQANRVELVSKDMKSVLPIAFFPAITKPGSRTLFASRKYENPLAIQMRRELSTLMSLPDQGYIEEHFLLQLR